VESKKKSLDTNIWTVMERPGLAELALASKYKVDFSHAVATLKIGPFLK
jgi:hypothetical protein